MANGNDNPAQEILDVDATHGDDLRRKTRIYAFGAALGGQGVLDSARALAAQSDIPAPADPGQPREHLHPQRPELRQPEERVRRPPDPVPGKDR